MKDSTRSPSYLEIEREVESMAKKPVVNDKDKKDKKDKRDW